MNGAEADRFDVVVVGGGFGGAYAARELERRLRGPAGSRPKVLLVSDQNFMLFAPVLPEAASGTLEPRHAVIPLREMLRRTSVRTGRVEAVDTEARTVTMADVNGQRSMISYRFLVLAPGSVARMADVPGLADRAVGFKTLDDATWLRNRVLFQLEAAEATDDPGERRRLLTFVFVGGGYAGVEGLAELESLAQAAIRRLQRVKPDDMRWVLIEASGTLLPGLNPRLAQYTETQLRKRGIVLHLSTRVVECTSDHICVDDASVDPIPCPTVVWTTGQQPNPLVAQSGLPLDGRGRVIVDDHLRVQGRDDIFAVGDSAAVPDRGGGLSPPTAQHAMRQGRRAGRNVAAALGGGKSARFDYRNRGLAVTLGNARGTAQVYGVTFTGFPAWFMGRTYHLWMMPGRARQARVISDWTIGLLFPRDTSQLGQAETRPPV